MHTLVLDEHGSSILSMGKIEITDGGRTIWGHRVFLWH